MLDEELARLPEKYRAPILMCVLEGKPYRDAAAALGCSRTAVLRRIQAGRRRAAATGPAGRDPRGRRAAGLLAAVGGEAARPPVRLLVAAVESAMASTAAGQAAALAPGLLASGVWSGQFKLLLGVLAVVGVVGGTWAGVKLLTPTAPVVVAAPDVPPPRPPAAGRIGAPGCRSRRSRGAVGGRPYGGALPAGRGGNGGVRPGWARPCSGLTARRYSGGTGDGTRDRTVRRAGGRRRDHSVGRREEAGGFRRGRGGVGVGPSAGRPRPRAGHTVEPTGVVAVALSPDGSLLACGTNWKQGIDVFAVVDGAWRAHPGRARRPARRFAPDGKTLASADRNQYRDVVLWDVPTMTRRVVLTSTDRPNRTTRTTGR